MDKNTVLVVMPIYNAEDTLPLAIESILKQTYKNFQLVLVDDASTDGSLEIAKSYTYDKRVTVYSNKENRGAYYSRNVGLLVYSNKPWGYFTTHDADDVSFEHRFQMLVDMLASSKTNGVQDIFERKDYKTKRSLSKTLTIAHAMFKRSVFDKIGYFEQKRVGADWEHWARLTAYNHLYGLTTRALRQQVGVSFVHDNNLTKQVPLGSVERRQYIDISRANHKVMLEKKNFYIPFKMDNSNTKLVKYSASDKPQPAMIKTSDGKKFCVVLLTWQRIPFLKQTLRMLADQTFKDFTVRITNANLGQKEAVERVAAQFSNRLKIDVTHEGNDLKAFRRFTVGQELAKNGVDAILFIDDDITFSADYVKRMVEGYQEKSYQSGFAWNFQRGGENYYKYRTRRWDNNETIHYCGTGISIIDASIFLDTRLFNVPPEAYYIEDLWLSYFAQHVLNWQLKYINVGNVKIGGTDNNALYKQILADKQNAGVPDKADFLRLLVKKYKWRLL